MSETLTFLIVKGTLVLLVTSSAFMWALVVIKGVQSWRVAREDRHFAAVLEKVSRLPSPQDVAAHSGPVARMALAGAEAWEESARTVGDGPDHLDVRRDLLERSLRQQLQRERRGAEKGLPVFASIGSTAPFVGLFGTVLGIIHALQRIGVSGSASLDVVAGPIGEALVATGIGIAVAVPAVLAYNYFLRRLKSRLSDLEDFANTFVNNAIKSAFAEDREQRRASRPVSVRREATA
jgi:biopolymer transport protein ExbB